MVYLFCSFCHMQVTLHQGGGGGHWRPPPVSCGQAPSSKGATDDFRGHCSRSCTLRMEQACLDSACPPARALEQAHGLHSPSTLAVCSSTKDQLHIHSARRLRFTIQGLAALLMPGCGVTIGVVLDPQKMAQWLKASHSTPMRTMMKS